MSRAVKKGLLARKIGMTQIFTEDGQAVAVTAIEAGPCVVVRKKTRRQTDTVQFRWVLRGLRNGRSTVRTGDNLPRPNLSLPDG